MVASDNSVIIWWRK